MKSALRSLLSALLCLASFTAAAASIATCTGRFPNPITDICWSCILPLSIGGATIGNFGGQEDNGNPGTPVCSCGVNPTIGLSVGFSGSPPATSRSCASPSACHPSAA
jgi:conjugal transfer pilus assembly protein TraU